MNSSRTMNFNIFRNIYACHQKSSSTDCVQTQFCFGKDFFEFVLSLESDCSFTLRELYELSLTDFELAITLLEEWRLDRYYIGKAKAFDVAYQANDQTHQITNS